MFYSKLPDQFTDFNNLNRIKTYRGFVENNVLRISKQCLCNSHTLPVTLGKMLDQPILHLLYLCFLHNTQNFIFHFAFCNTLGSCNKCQVFLRRLLHVKRWKLREITDALFRHLPILKNVVSVNFYLPCSGRETSGQYIHGGRFSRTIGSKKTIDMPFPDGERDIVYGCERVIFFRQMFNRNHCKPPFCLFLTE